MFVTILTINFFIKPNTDLELVTQRFLASFTSETPHMEVSSFLYNLLGRVNFPLTPGAALAVQGHDGLGI